MDLLIKQLDAERETRRLKLGKCLPRRGGSASVAYAVGLAIVVGRLIRIVGRVALVAIGHDRLCYGY